MRHYLNAMRRYFDFSGRSSRAEFWFFVLFVFILSIVANVLDAVLFGSYAYGAAVLSALVSLIVLIVLLVFYCTPGTPGPNRYGPPPPP
jgi:uncharacterized membrane protein YhaH (DUF805 family)